MEEDTCNLPSGHVPAADKTAHAAAEGQTIPFVAGPIGWDASGRIADGLTARVSNRRWSNILTVLAQAGRRDPTPSSDRLTSLVRNRHRPVPRTAKAIGPGSRRIMGKHFPAMSVITSARWLNRMRWWK